MSPICRALPFKGDDALQVSFFAETTSKILVLASDGKVVHARRRETAGRARAGRADPPDGGHRRGRGHRRGLALPPGGKMLVGAHRRARLRGRAGRDAVVDPQGQGGADVDAPAKARLAIPAERRPCRGDRREPKAAGLPAVAGSRNGARQGRAPATLQGRRPLRRAGLRARTTA